MKKITTSLVLIMLFVAAEAQTDRKLLTTADYDQAVKQLSFNTGKLIDGGPVNPNWLPDGKMWYAVSAGGKTSYVLIDPATGKKTTASDLQSLVPGAAAETRGRGRRNFSPTNVSPNGKMKLLLKTGTFGYGMWTQKKKPSLLLTVQKTSAMPPTMPDGNTVTGPSCCGARILKRSPPFSRTSAT